MSQWIFHYFIIYLENLFVNNREVKLINKTILKSTNAAAYALSLTSGIGEVERKNIIVGRAAAESNNEAGI